MELFGKMFFSLLLVLSLLSVVFGRPQDSSPAKANEEDLKSAENDDLKTANTYGFGYGYGFGYPYGYYGLYGLGYGYPYYGYYGGYGYPFYG